MTFPYIYRMILVTGGTGLVGAHLLAKLAATQEKIRAIFRSEEKKAIAKKILSYYYAEETEGYFSKIEWIKADIADISALTDAFQGITKVYHCAGLVSFDASDEEMLRKINVEGTANVVNLSISSKIEKLCHVSSIAALGKQPVGKSIDEESNFEFGKSHSWYAITKFEAEMEVWRGSQEGLDVVIVNPGIIIGPGIWHSGSGLLFQKIWEGWKYHFPKKTGFVAVEDVAEIMPQLMRNSVKNERFVLVSENVSFETILKNIAVALKKPVPSIALKPWMLTFGWIFQWMGAILFGTKQQIARTAHRDLFETSIYDSSKIKKLFSFNFRSIENSIEKTAAIFLKEKGV